MAAERLREFLDRRGVKYISIRHSPAFTAQEIAELAHVAGRDFAKTVIVKIEGELAMVVLPATRRLVLSDLAELLEKSPVKLASEEEFVTHFPDCEAGAMPPFGYLYGMKTYVAGSLTEQKEIAFNAGTHHEVIKMAYDDFASIVTPVVLDFVTN